MVNLETMLIGYKTELSIARFNKNCIEGQSLGGRNLVFRCLRMAENFKDKISPSASSEMIVRALCHLDKAVCGTVKERS